MNFNSQQQWLEHYLNLQTASPPKMRVLQEEINQKRVARIERAMKTRPYRIGLQFVLPAAEQLSPVRVTTPSLPHDVIILGAISNDPTREIIWRRSERDENFAYVGEENNLYLTLEEMSGQSAQPQGGGQRGAFYFSAPIMLKANRRMTFEMFKNEPSDAPVTVWLTLICLRTLKYNTSLDEVQSKAVKKALLLNDAPEQRFIKQKITFDANGEARNVLSPVGLEEPHLIRGVKTSLNHSLVENVGIEGEPDWALEPFPLWSLASEPATAHENYSFFARPVFLPAKTQFTMSLKNSLDGGEYSDGETGTITWLLETV